MMRPGKASGLTRKSCPIVECEFIYDVVGNGTNFAIVNSGNPFPINPGQATTFPWASTIAKQFDKYKFEYIQLEYRREV